MGQFIRVASTADLAPGETRCVEAPFSAPPRPPPCRRSSPPAQAASQFNQHEQETAPHGGCLGAPPNAA